MTGGSADHVAAVRHRLRGQPAQASTERGGEYQNARLKYNTLEYGDEPQTDVAPPERSGANSSSAELAHHSNSDSVGDIETEPSTDQSDGGEL